MGVRFRLSNRSFVKMIGRFVARRLSNLNGAKPTNLSRRGLSNPLAIPELETSTGSAISDGLLVGIWAFCIYNRMSHPWAFVSKPEGAPVWELASHLTTRDSHQNQSSLLPSNSQDYKSHSKCSNVLYYLFVRI